MPRWERLHTCRLYFSAPITCSTSCSKRKARRQEATQGKTKTKTKTKCTSILGDHALHSSNAVFPDSWRDSCLSPVESLGSVKYRRDSERYMAVVVPSTMGPKTFEFQQIVHYMATFDANHKGCRRGKASVSQRQGPLSQLLSAC